MLPARLERRKCDWQSADNAVGWYALSHRRARTWWTMIAVSGIATPIADSGSATLPTPCQEPFTAPFTGMRIVLTLIAGMEYESLLGSGMASLPRLWGSGLAAVN